MRKFLTLAAACCLCAALCGCSGLGLLKAAHRKAAADKDVYTVAEGQPARLEGGEGPLWILAETVPPQRRGAWTGGVERWLVVDAAGAVLGQTELDDLAAVKALCGEAQGQVVAYYNVYQDAEREDALLVEVDGALHPLTAQEPQNGLFAPRAAGEEDVWRLGEDCRVLLHGEARYRVTAEAVDEAGGYLGMLAQTVVFDAETGRQIPREELQKIEWTPGALSAQQRVQRTYGAVYSLPGSADAVAVEVDGALLAAKAEK